jgi:hypothetical protein
MRRDHYERDDQAFPAHAYSVGRSGVAFHVLGWETEPDEDTEWTGQEQRTGRVVAVMVGDNRKHSVDPDDLTPPWTRRTFAPGVGRSAAPVTGRRSIACSRPTPESCGNIATSDVSWPTSIATTFA